MQNDGHKMSAMSKVTGLLKNDLVRLGAIPIFDPRPSLAVALVLSMNPQRTSSRIRRKKSTKGLTQRFCQTQVC